MTTTIKLTVTQANILKAAAERGDGNIEPLPPSLRGRRQDHGASRSDQPRLGIPTGRSLLDDRRRLRGAGTLSSSACRCRASGMLRKSAKKPVRKSSKQAIVIQMLQRPEGATIPQIREVTGWLAHSARGFLAGTVKKKLGLAIVSEKPEDGVRTYKIEGSTERGQP